MIGLLLNKYWAVDCSSPALDNGVDVGDDVCDVQGGSKEIIVYSPRTESGSLSKKLT